MAYDNARYQVTKVFTFPAVGDLTAAADIGAMKFTENGYIVAFGITVTEAVVAQTTAPVVAVKNGATTIDEITVADATAAGSILENALTSIDVDADDKLTFSVTTAGVATTAGDETGAGYLYIRYKERFVI
jgi:hypothetical protein